MRLTYIWFDSLGEDLRRGKVDNPVTNSWGGVGVGGLSPPQHLLALQAFDLINCPGSLAGRTENNQTQLDSLVVVPFSIVKIFLETAGDLKS